MRSEPLSQLRTYGIALVGLLLFAILAIRVDRFLSVDNLLNMVRQVSLIGILSVGMTWLFVAGELDLSVDRSLVS